MSSASRRLVEALDAVGAEPGGVTVTDLSRELDVSKATGSRLLASLVEAGLVTKVDHQRHVLDLRLWSWGVQATARVRKVSELARPLMIEAVRTSGVPIAISVPSDDQNIFLEIAAPSRDAVVGLPCTSIMPLYACAPGKAMLAFSGDDRVEEILSGSLERFTEHTIAAPDALRDELEQIRTHGYALNRGEFWADTVAVAVPIFDSTHSPVAAVGSSGPSATLDVADLERLVPTLASLSDSISAALGYLPATYMVG